MTLPTIEPIPSEDASLPPARRRRQRRMIVPEDSSERAALMRTLARRTVPSFDFFLYSLLAGLTLGIAMLLDAPALFVLAALVAPFMAPALGIALGTLAGTPRFIIESLASLSIGSLIVFLCGAVAGWAATLLPARAYPHTATYSQFSWSFFFVLGLGSIITAYLLARWPNQKPLVASVAIAYGLYLPVGTAGFGMTSAAGAMWPEGLILFATHLLWAVLAVILTLAATGLRPLKFSAYAFSALFAAAGLALLLSLAPQVGIAAPGSPQADAQTPAAAEVTNTPQELAQATDTKAAQQSSQTPEPVFTPSPLVTPTPSATVTTTPTPTRTLVPSRTPTVTITPAPTPIFARIDATLGDGALVRENPDYGAEVVQSVLNGTVVEVLPEVSTNASGEAWVHIRLVNGKEGWVVRSLLRTATPAPTW